MLDFAGLAVHQLWRAYDVAAKRRADRLMPEADAENRNSGVFAFAKCLINSMLMPASCGVHGPGEITIRSGCSASTSAG